MIRKNFRKLKEELAGYQGRERAFILFALCCTFFICVDYAMVRPIGNSLFINSFGTRFFPYAWIAMVPVNFLLVGLYNRLLPKWGTKRLFFTLMSTVFVVNTSFAILYKTFPLLAFPFYMWKELYVMLLFQMVWSVIHSNIQLSRAKYLYGMFFGFGGLGSVFGSSFPGFFAVRMGTENILLLSPIVYACLAFVYGKLNRYSNGEVPKENQVEKGGFLHGVRLIRSSRFLIFALLSVLFMQMTVAITDFQLSDFLERLYQDKDIRTQMVARIMGIVHSSTVILQFIGTYILIRILGYRKANYFVPTLLALSASLLLIAPLFGIVAFGFIATKTLDFAVFGPVKEMLYVPLKPDEKFRAKAVIDVFVYRTSKAVSSFMILLVTSFVAAPALSWVTLSIALLWMGSVAYGLKEYEAVTNEAA